MLAQAPEPETTHLSFSLLDDHVDDLSAPPEEAVLVAAAETELEDPRDSSDASQMCVPPHPLFGLCCLMHQTGTLCCDYRFIAHVNMLLAQLFALFQDFPNFIKLPPVLTNATQRSDMRAPIRRFVSAALSLFLPHSFHYRPVMLLWRKIMHFTDAHHALRPRYAKAWCVLFFICAQQVIIIALPPFFLLVTTATTSEAAEQLNPSGRPSTRPSWSSKRSPRSRPDLLPTTSRVPLPPLALPHVSLSLTSSCDGCPQRRTCGSSSGTSCST
jgi:hypothetical protein